MAATNFIDSTFLTLTSNTVLPNAADIGYGTSGYVLTSAGGTTNPSWAATSGGLPTTPTSGTFTLGSFNGTVGWKSRTPSISRSVFQGGSSSFPAWGGSTNTVSYVADATVTVYSGDGNSVASENQTPGINGGGTLKYYYSIYMTGTGTQWTTQNSTNGFQFGWINSSFWTANYPSGFQSYTVFNGPDNGILFRPSNTGMAMSDSSSTGSATNISTVSGTYTQNFQGLILSVGYDSTVSTNNSTVWLHSSTGSLIWEGQKTTAGTDMGSAANGIKPFFLFMPPIGIQVGEMQMMTVGYPAISGWTYFYSVL
jgi:hypothetical protein